MLAEPDMVLSSFTMIWCKSEPSGIDFSKLPQTFLEKLEVKLPLLEG